MTNCTPTPHIPMGFCCLQRILLLIKVCDLGEDRKAVKMAKHGGFLQSASLLGLCGDAFKPWTSSFSWDHSHVCDVKHGIPLYFRGTTTNIRACFFQVHLKQLIRSGKPDKIINRRVGTPKPDFFKKQKNNPG